MDEHRAENTLGIFHAKRDIPVVERWGSPHSCRCCCCCQDDEGLGWRRWIMPWMLGCSQSWHKGIPFILCVDLLSSKPTLYVFLSFFTLSTVTSIYPSYWPRTAVCWSCLLINRIDGRGNFQIRVPNFVSMQHTDTCLGLPYDLRLFRSAIRRTAKSHRSRSWMARNFSEWA